MQKFELVLLVRDADTNSTARFDIRDDVLIEEIRERLSKEPPARYSLGGWRGGILALPRPKADHLLAAEPPETGYAQVPDETPTPI